MYQRSTTYKPTEKPRFPVSVKLVTPENRFWNSFKRVRCESSAVTRSGHVPVVTFAQTVPFDCAAISGGNRRLSLLSVTTSGELCVANELNFTTEITHCDIRSDGQLIAVAGKKSTLRVYKLGVGRNTDAALVDDEETGDFSIGGSGAIKLFKALNGHHTSHVNVARFRGRIGNQLASIGDDHTVRLFDLTEVKQLISIQAHSDFVKCGDWYDPGTGLFMSGAYDHSVKLWDIRSGDCEMTLERSSPIESLIRIPDSDLIAVANGPSVDVFSLRKLQMTSSKSAPLCSILNHRKEVSDLAVNAEGTRLFAACLDQFVRIYDVASFDTSVAKLTHSFQCDSAALSVDVAKDGMSVAIGTLKDGAVIRNCSNPSGNKTRLDEIIAAKRAKALEKDPMLRIDEDIHEFMNQTDSESRIRYGSSDWFKRGQKVKEPYFLQDSGDSSFRSANPAMGEVTAVSIVRSKKRRRLAPYDVALKDFRYADALDLAMGTRDTLTVHAVLEDLWRRDGLGIAVGGRDEDGLRPLLEYLVYSVSQPHLSGTSIHVASLVIDLYSSVVGMSSEIDLLFVQLHRTVESLVTKNKVLLKLQGAVDSLLSAQQIHFSGRKRSVDVLGYDLDSDVASIMRDLKRNTAS